MVRAGSNPNECLPRLFIELFPAWLAALVGIGILSAIMSTADGLVVSSSQIIANDLYRRTFVPMFRPELTADELDRRVLAISRIGTAATLLICTVMSWFLIQKNIALIVWIGIGGMMAAFAGPLVVGGLWRSVTRKGAYAGLISGFAVFIVLHAELLEPSWFGSGTMHNVVSWLRTQGPNPFSCAAIGELTSIGLTWLVSQFTQPLPESHLRELFGGD